MQTFPKAPYINELPKTFVENSFKVSSLNGIYKSPFKNQSPGNEIKEIQNSGSISVNLPKNSTKFVSLKEYDQKNALEISNISSKINKNKESFLNQSLSSQINENINGYKKEKMENLEEEVSNLLKNINEKQNEITRLKGDIKGLTIALKEKDIIQKDYKFLETSLNKILMDNSRLNDLLNEKIAEANNLKENLLLIEKEKSELQKKYEDNIANYQFLTEGSNQKQNRFLKEIEILKENNKSLVFEMQSLQIQRSNTVSTNIYNENNEILRLKKEVECLMKENIRLNEITNEKTFINENILELIQKSDELIKENERLNILIKEQTLENNSWRQKLYDSDQNFLKCVEKNKENIREISNENEELKQKNKKYLEEINQLIFLIQEKDKIVVENENLKKIIEKKDELINELAKKPANQENFDEKNKELQKKSESLLLENIKLNNFIQEKLNEYNALEDLNNKIEILISENEKLNLILSENQKQMEYWKARYFSVK